ncbi:NCS2 family permease [Carboxydochorda subterranea]|uniref:NCS2 family permease n=1 Tax=Carboxydichorda subterranea TaxID=3109565 RepID=A0ABZ1BU53_9FIRM|nr:NCS2 family permease [Limnochorda sp. L945t]WRP16178.1 NCS2 family permease [Limnochorda sp. L945t]
MATSESTHVSEQAFGEPGPLERRFRLRERSTTAGAEAVAGVTTFMTMAYILFVNPSILGAAGMPAEAVAVATAVAAGLTTLAMGLYTNYPFALAPGMGLNAALAYGLVLGQHVPWQTAMGVIFVEGALVTLLVLTNVREAVMDAIPLALKRAIGAGIGLFIAFIGLTQSGIVVRSEATLVTFGSFTDPKVLLTFGGLLVTATLLSLRVRGAILIGILLTALAGVPLGITQWPQQWVRLPHAGSFSTFFQLDVAGALQLGLLSAIFAFMMTDFFDTMGTVVAVAGEGGLLDREGRLPGIRRVLLVDSLAAVTGGLAGASSVTTYVESAAGVAEGGRTGLSSVVTAVLFFLAIFFAPVLVVVPPQATAAALVVVGFLMLGTVVREIHFERYDEAFPAFITLLTIPLTYSIARGIGYGFITYVVIKLLTGRPREVHPALWAVAALFVLSFVWAS